MAISVAVLSGFGFAILAPLLARRLQGSAGWVLAVLPAVLTLYFISLLPRLQTGNPVAIHYAWVPELGVNFALRADGLSLLFAILISGIGTFVVIYAGGYLAGDRDLNRFYPWLLIFMASMLGVVLADNLLVLFVFWELTSLSSFMLIGYEHDREEARAAALQALLVTSSGGLALLAGLVLIGQAAGSYEISVLLNQGEAIRNSPYYLPALVLVLLGAFTKSAQVPFHFWLPSAMEAPTPVSAYLHSATMVKAGIYVLARLSPVLGGTEAWLVIVSGVGVLTMLVGAYLALYYTNLKRILAYTTISSLGTIVLLLGIGASGAVKAAMVFLLAHAFYKAALFMLAGVLYHETGTQDIDELGGLRRVMPYTALITFLAAISLAGFGPVLSFIGKELLFEAVLEAHRFSLILSVTAVLTGAVNVAVALILAIRPFLGASRQTPKHAHEAPLSLLVGPGSLALLGLGIGLFPALVAGNLITPTVTAILGESYSAELALWHGVNPALLLSGISILSGVLLYRGWTILRSANSRLERFLNWGPTVWYNASLIALNNIARSITNVLQSGHLHYYMLIIVLTTVGLVGYSVTFRLGRAITLSFPVVRFYELGLGILILLAALAAVRSRSRLASVAALGVVGYGVALTFIFFGAPDLAMTQILIETMTVILLVLVLYHLPGFAQLSSKVARRRDAIIALIAGTLMTLLVLLVSSFEHIEPISSFFITNSVPLGHGRNIVNVILVDFRALDTLGEITVLSLAGIGVLALLKLRIGKAKRK